MDKRFVKNNILLIAVAAISVTVAVVLLVISLIDYVQTEGYISRARDLRNQIAELGRKNPSPVEGNKFPISEDTKLYRRTADELNSHFGHPFDRALDLFIVALDIKLELPPDELTAFNESVQEETKSMLEAFAAGGEERAELVKQLALAPELAASLEKAPAAVLEKNLTPVIRAYLLDRRTRQYFFDRFGLTDEQKFAYSKMPMEQLNKELQPYIKKDFIAKFKEEWGKYEDSQYSEHFVIWQRFKKNYPNWNAAAMVFIKEAQPFTIEKIERGTNSDAILQQALGVRRSFYGDPVQRATDLSSYVDGIQKTVSELLSNGKIDRVPSGRFGFSVPGGSDQTQFDVDGIPNIIRHWEIIGDIGRRLSTTGIKTLHNLIVRVPAGENGQMNVSGSFESSGSYEVAHYTIEVTGKMSAIRDFAAKLNSAWSDNRMYVIRSVFLYAENDGAFGMFRKDVAAPQDGNEAAPRVREPVSRRGSRRAIFNEEGAPVDEGSSRSSDDAVTRIREARKRQAEREKSMPFFKRSGYGEILVGADEECRAVFDIDYVVMSNK